MCPSDVPVRFIAKFAGKLRIVLISILFFHFFSFTNAQAVVNGLLGACEDDYGQDMAFFPDGTKFLLTNSYSYKSDGQHFLITKSDGNGSQIWSKLFFGSNYDFSYSIKKNGNNLMVAGTTLRPGGYRVFVMQIDTSGKVKWCNTYISGAAYAMSVCSNGDIVVTGEKSEISGYYKLFVLRIDSLGAVRWGRQFYSVYSSKGQDIIETNDKAILVSGKLGYGSDTVGSESCRPVAVKLDNDGNVIWMNYYLFNGTYFSYGVAPFTILIKVIQCSYDSTYLISGTYSYLSGQMPFLLKVNSKDGNIIWNKTYSFGYNAYFSGLHINGYNLYLYGNSTISSDSYNMVVINADIKGNIKWSKVYGRSYNNYINSLSTQGNKLNIVGSIGNFYGARKSWTRYDSYNSEMDTNGMGSVLPDSTIVISTGTIGSVGSYSDFYTGTLSASSIPMNFSDSAINAILDTSLCEPLGISNYAVSKNISIYPNPGDGKFSIDLSGGNYSLILYNSYGQIVLENNYYGPKIDIDISKFNNGLYQLKIKTADVIYTGKILKQ